MSELKNKHLGDAGYDFFKDICNALEPYRLVQSTLKEDMYEGFDGVLLNQTNNKVIGKVDVKNTQDIYFINYKIAEKRIVIRHPLKASSQADYVGIVSSNSKEFFGLLTQEQWLAKYIKKDFIKSFLSQLHDYDGKSIDAALGSKTVSTSQACLKLKQALLPFLKIGVYISYEEPMDLEIISFKLSCNKKLDSIPFSQDYIENLNSSIVIEETKQEVKEVVETTRFNRENYYKINL